MRAAFPDRPAFPHGQKHILCDIRLYLPLITAVRLIPSVLLPAWRSRSWPQAGPREPA